MNNPPAWDINTLDLTVAETVEDVARWLDAEVVSALDSTPRSRSGRVIKSKGKEWPPACPRGCCDMRKGCLCMHSTTVAGDYFDCAAEIYGYDAPGMPCARPTATKSAPDQCGTPKANRRRGRATPEGARSVKRCKLSLPEHGPREECVSPTPLPTPRVVQTLTMEPDQVIASPETLMFLFADVQCENSAPSNLQQFPLFLVDLWCDEDPEEAVGGVKKRVTWSGLPPNPPTWVSGRRRAVPKLWAPCKHVIVQDALMCLKYRLSPESCIKTLPSWNVSPTWM